MSDGTGTMSVQLVLCVADSVWRAAGHLARLCMPTAHSHRACCSYAAVLPLAVLLFHCRDDVPPRPQLLLVMGRGCAAVTDSADDRRDMARL